jgi:hypothetical protein
MWKSGWSVRPIKAQATKFDFVSVKPLMVLPGDAPPVEVPPVVILFTMLVSMAGIFLIALKMIHREKEREGKEIPVEFARRLNTTSVATIMILLGTLAPCCITYRSFTDPMTLDIYFQLNLVSFLWSLWVEVDFWRFDLPSLPVLAWSLVLLAFYLIFVYEVVEYCHGQTSWTKTVLAWLISQLPLLIMIIPVYLSGGFPGSLFYTGPTYITLVVGLIIMRIAGPKPSGEPWREKND